MTKIMSKAGNKIRSKKQLGGFTLVEVIVVAVIVLILAAVAIPMYNGFVRQARQDAVDNLAETAAAAANSYWRKTGEDPALGDFAANTGSLKLYYDDNKHVITVAGSTITVRDVKSGDDCSSGNTICGEAVFRP